MSSNIANIDAIPFSGVVNVLPLAPAVARSSGGESACAAAARLAVVGQPTAGRFAVKSDNHLFEGETTGDESLVLVEDAGLGSELGIPVRTSSIAEGMIVVAAEGDEILGASRIDMGDLALDSENEVFGGPVISALTVVGQVAEKATIFAMSTKAKVAALIDDAVKPADNSEYSFTLDGVYTGVNTGHFVVITLGSMLEVVRVITAYVGSYELKDNGFKIPLTTIKIKPPAFALETVYQISLEIWHNPVQAGELVRLASKTASPEQVLAQTAISPSPASPLAIVDADGSAVLIDAGNIPDTTLTLPATIYTNLALATRGETIKNEILGSGDASIPFQSFRLKKSPLTYLADPTAPNGRRSTLEVHVNGQKWREAQSFYGARATDQIYVVRHDEDHQSFIVFGDGELGQCVPTGSNNVVATYRFGVGGNVPANSITTLKKPVKGVRKVFNPLPATGGKEPPTPEQMRREGPLGMLVLGRLVSLPDFEAETRRYGNVVNAKARLGWDEAGEDAKVQVWFATRDEGDPWIDLRYYLQGMAEPNTRVSVTKAEAVPGTLTIDLVVDPRYKAEDVEFEVARRLFDDWDGVLSVRNMPIGGRLHRSKLSVAIHSVPGVLGINGIILDDEPMPFSRSVADGKYLDLENIHLIVGGTEAGKRLFGEN